MSKEALIVSAVRTPVGRAGGVLAEVRADDLAAIAVRACVDRAGFDPARLDDVILGCTNQAGEDNRNVARMAVLLAGLPVDIPGQTVNRLCGSGLQAIASAAQAIKAGEGDAFVAGGVESMTRAPYVMLKSGEPWNRQARGDVQRRDRAGRNFRWQRQAGDRVARRTSAARCIGRQARHAEAGVHG